MKKKNFLEKNNIITEHSDNTAYDKLEELICNSNNNDYNNILVLRALNNAINKYYNADINDINDIDDFIFYFFKEHAFQCSYWDYDDYNSIFNHNINIDDFINLLQSVDISNLFVYRPDLLFNIIQTISTDYNIKDYHKCFHTL